MASEIHLLHAMVKSTFVLQNVSENQRNEREEALEPLRLVQLQQQPRTGQAREHLSEFVVASEPQNKTQNGVQSVGVHRQAEKHHRTSATTHTENMQDVEKKQK